MSQYSARRDSQLHRIETALKEIESWPERKRVAMRAMIQALEAERDEVMRSHRTAVRSPSRRLIGLAEGLAA